MSERSNSMEHFLNDIILHIIQIISMSRESFSELLSLMNVVNVHRLFSLQSIFILSEKSWSGSSLLYRWQKSLGNYIAVAG